MVGTLLGLGFSGQVRHLCEDKEEKNICNCCVKYWFGPGAVSGLPKHETSCVKL